MIYGPYIYSKIGQNVHSGSHSAHVSQAHFHTDQFTFLPTFSSHLHGVRVTPEQGRKPCGRIRKWSISENTVE